MIRPFTFLCLLLAGAAGLYLYQVKHHTRMLEIEIDHTLKQADAIRAQTGLLQAEWAFLNDPTRLADLADQKLALKPIDSRQFVQMTDLDRRLPPVPPPEAPPLAAVPTPAPNAATPTASTPTASTANLAPVEGALPPPKLAAPAAPMPRPQRLVAQALSIPPARKLPPAPVHRPQSPATLSPATPLPMAQTRLPYAPYAATADAHPYRPVATAAGSSALGDYRAALPPPVPVVTTSPADYRPPRSGR